jgi:hypothetical protein
MHIVYTVYTNLYCVYTFCSSSPPPPSISLTRPPSAPVALDALLAVPARRCASCHMCISIQANVSLLHMGLLHKMVSCCCASTRTAAAINQGELAIHPAQLYTATVSHDYCTVQANCSYTGESR